MEKVSVLLLLLVLTWVGELKAQEESIPREGLTRAMLTLSPSLSFSKNHSTFYLHGNLERYITDRISLSGEGYYSLKNSNDNNVFEYNHSAFFGASWHFIKKNNDLYAGIQPGFSFTKLNASETSSTFTSRGVNPLFSSVVGYNFYVNKIFHFFLQSRLVLGQHNYDVHTSLSELRFSAGLGFNL